MSLEGLDFKLEELLDVRVLSKFTLVGAIGFLVENFLLFSLVDLIGLHLFLSKLVGVEASLITMFILNDRFTFESSTGSRIGRFKKSHIVRSGGILVSVAVLWAGTRVGVWYILANSLGIFAGFAFNYMFESSFTWG